MVTEGDFQGSPNKNLSAVNEILNQKLFVIITDAMKSGMAIKLPAMQTHALNIGFPYPNLSDMSPPAKDDTNPQTMLMTE